MTDCTGTYRSHVSNKTFDEMFGEMFGEIFGEMFGEMLVRNGQSKQSKLLSPTEHIGRE